MEISGETPAGEIFGTSETDNSHVMSERVQALASGLYEEFEHMIKKYDEDVVKELMPHIVNILETLDGSFSDKQENEVELELLREDNEQLLAQYDREKQLRKTADQKLMEVEDAIEDERKRTEEKLENLESLVRTLELKGKNATDHVSRLEDKEAEMKKEYNKLHERYTDLFKTHTDYVERTRNMIHLERSDSHSPRVKGFVMPTLRPVKSPHSTVNVAKTMNAANETSKMNGPGHAVQQSNSSEQQENHNDLRAELYDATKSDGNAHEDFDLEENHVIGEADLRQTMAEIVETTPELEEFDSSYGSSLGNSSRLLTYHQDTSEQDSSIFDELNQENPDVVSELDEGADMDGVGKEIENLIAENAELLETKNALNIVKDDLIAQVDDLTSEIEMIRGELRSLRAVTDRYKERIGELEDHLKKQKEDFEARSRGDEDGDDVPRAQRKRFTRVEMARVLMERNQYKERLMELQEAVRWTEMIRAAREHPDAAPEKQKKSSIWNLFGNLFGDSNEQEKRPANSPTKVKYAKGPGLPTHL